MRLLTIIFRSSHLLSSYRWIAGVVHKKSSRLIHLFRSFSHMQFRTFICKMKDMNYRFMINFIAIGPSTHVFGWGRFVIVAWMSPRKQERANIVSISVVKFMSCVCLLMLIYFFSFIFPNPSLIGPNGLRFDCWLNWEIIWFVFVLPIKTYKQ